MENNQLKINTPRWGLLGTLIGSTLVAFTYIIISTLVVFVYLLATTSHLNESKIEEQIKGIESNGTVLGLITIISLFVCGGLIIGIVKFKKGSDLKEYFGFNKLPFKIIFLWILALTGFILFADLLTISLGKPVVPDVMKLWASSTTVPWLLFFAIIIAAPILEELFFRGFLFAGISSSSLGPIGAIIITSLFWSVLHIQYGYYEIITIFFMGLLLGYAKHKTDSIYLTMILHIFNNTGSSIEYFFS